MSEQEVDRFIETLQRDEVLAQRLLLIRDRPNDLFAEVQRRGFDCLHHQQKVKHRNVRS